MQFGMMDGYGYGMGYGMGILGLIFWILVIIGACSSYQIPVGRRRS